MPGLQPSLPRPRAARGLARPLRERLFGPTGELESTAGASHAWVEVCGAEGTWAGLDPTHGGHVGPHHLRLAVGRDYGDVAPHRGVFYGTARAATPEVTVRVTRMSERAARVAERGTALHWQQQQQQQG